MVEGSFIVKIFLALCYFALFRTAASAEESEKSLNISSTGFALNSNLLLLQAQVNGI